LVAPQYGSPVAYLLPEIELSWTVDDSWLPLSKCHLDLPKYFKRIFSLSRLN
jgi:hypothetical protein